MPEISLPTRPPLSPRVTGLLDAAHAACGVAGIGLDLEDRPEAAYVGDPTAQRRGAVAVCDRDQVKRGELVAYDRPDLADEPLPEEAGRHLAAVAAAIGDVISVEAFKRHELELTSAVDLTQKAGRKREQREDRVRRHVGALFRGHVTALRAALEDAAADDGAERTAGGWHGAARRAVGLERAAAWAEELERLLDDLAVAREGLDEPVTSPHRLEDLVDSALDRMSHLGQRLGAADGPRVVSMRDALLAVDGEAVQRALQHLLTSALTGDPVEDRAEHVEIDAVADGDEVVVTIADDGAPHRAEQMRTRLARGFGGTDAEDAGLAIQVVDAVARAHGGRCWVERSELGGARVSIVLPAASGELRDWRSRGGAQQPAVSPRPSLADDEPAGRPRHPSERLDETDSASDAEPAARTGDDDRPDNVRGLFERR